MKRLRHVVAPYAIGAATAATIGAIGATLAARGMAAGQLFAFFGFLFAATCAGMAWFSGFTATAATLRHYDGAGLRRWRWADVVAISTEDEARDSRIVIATRSAAGVRLDVLENNFGRPTSSVVAWLDAAKPGTATRE
jgi:hypothetical protein